MYIHVGNNKNIRAKNIVAVCDFDTATVAEVTRKYLIKCQQDMLIESANDALPKSFIIYFSEKEGFYKLCFSQLSPAAIVSRPTVFK